MDRKLPLALKIASIYFVVTGLIGLLFVLAGLTGISPQHTEFEQMSIAYKTGAYSKDLVRNILFLFSGITILQQKAIGRKAGLFALVLAAYYGGNAFAWGLMQGKPTLKAYLFSYAVVGLWNAIWFYILFRKSSKEVLS
jgi:hypothetical protein